MAARRNFLTHLKTTFDAIYNDFMKEVKNADPEEYDDDDSEVELNMMVAKDGYGMLIYGISLEYSKTGFLWEIKTEKAHTCLQDIKLNCCEMSFPDNKYKGYYFSDSWNVFVEEMLETCVYLDAGEYGCVNLAKYEKDVQNRFEQLCMCSLISRHAHTYKIDPLDAQNMQRFL
jgi:hypothetical protein